MTGFEKLSDELHKGDDVHVLRRVSIILRHGRVEESEPGTAKDPQFYRRGGSDFLYQGTTDVLLQLSIGVYSCGS